MDGNPLGADGSRKSDAQGIKLTIFILTSHNPLSIPGSQLG